MAFVTPNSTQIPNVLIDQWMVELSDPELRVLLYVCRRTLGFHRAAEQITVAQMEHGLLSGSSTVLDRGVGVERKAILRATRSLRARGLIHVSGKNGKACFYSISLDGQKVPEGDFVEDDEDGAPGDSGGLGPGDSGGLGLESHPYRRNKEEIKEKPSSTHTTASEVPEGDSDSESENNAEAARLEQSKNCPVCRGKCLPNCRHACHGKPDLKPEPAPKKTRQFRQRNSGGAAKRDPVAFVPESWLADFEAVKREATGTGFGKSASRAQEQLAEPRDTLGHEKTLACYRAFLAGADPQWRAMGCFVRDVTAWDPAKGNGAGKAKTGGGQAYINELLAKAKAKRAAKEAA